MDITFEEWLDTGIAAGWCSKIVCQTHDGVPMTRTEQEEFEEGDPCIPVVRLWESDEDRVNAS